ncbi:MAG: T9SS type A sorting domain-containing protein [Saprospiraceae bacterium]|nr:T9SS type A sorting domain-containing protein [Lewinella sp.]
MNISLKQAALAFCIFFPLGLLSQTAPFSISIEPMNIDDLGGIQSFAFGQDNGKWLIVGGRLDGLHRRQPWASFDLAGHNNQLIVIDPLAGQKWTATLTSLPTSIQEQLSATDMEFYQEGDYLYCFGGYGYSATQGDHTTFGQLTAIKVPEVIDAVMNGTDFTAYFRQITDPKFQVTGGRVNKINDHYYLLGGQKFIGRYNPMGPDHGPGFIQEYTNSISIFSLTDDGSTITIDHLTSYTDNENLHRRDFNAVAQIMPNGEEGITMFSGVFQPTVDLPFLNCVNVDADGYAVNDSFQQYYNHYHCAVLPLYDAVDNQMHTVFFGGIAQYYDDSGSLVRDDDVPFIKTIAQVTRAADGTMTEYKLPVEMPALLGAGAEFIPNEELPKYNNQVVKLGELPGDKTLMGYIYGGISSSAPNIFFINDGTQSSASSQIFKVYLTRDNVLSLGDANETEVDTLEMRIYPNPNIGALNIDYHLQKSGDVKLTIRDTRGALIESSILYHQGIGQHTINQDIHHLSTEKMYLITLETPYERATQKLILKK